MNIDEVLQKVGLKYEDLKLAERDTLERWMQSINQKAITTNAIKEYVEQMRDDVEKELISEPEFERVFFGLIKVPNRKCVLLKARLDNYLLILAFMAGPEKAKVAMERALAGLVRSRS